MARPCGTRCLRCDPLVVDDRDRALAPSVPQLSDAPSALLAASGLYHLPGVEEELRLARDEGIPVIALGSPGGQASAIVERERRKDPPWTGLGNGFSDDVNALLADTDDYATTARILWERFGMPTK